MEIEENGCGGTKRKGEPMEDELGVIEKRQRFEADKIIDLLIEGKKIATFQSTLIKVYPSKLHDIFSSDSIPYPVVDGCFVIDRPKKPFIAILNFLRTGKLYVPKDMEAKAELDREIDFFGLREAYEQAASRGRIH